MKRTSVKILVIAMALLTVIGLCSCEVIEEILANIPGFSAGDQNEGGGNEDNGEGDGENGGNVTLEGLALIEGGKANFKIVQATQKGAPVRAKNLYDKLKELGIEVEAPIGDSDASKVTDCEIVIGADIRNREDCLISSRYLGQDGYQIKVVGNKVVIAGGSDKSLIKACEIFTTQILKITAKTKEGDIDNLAIPFDTAALKLHEYMITSLTIGGIPLSEYTLVLDVDAADDYALDEINGFRERLYSETGYWLENGKLDEIDTYEHKFIIRYTDEKLTNDDGQGFVAYVAENGDFIVECNYKNAIDGAFSHIIEKYFFGGMGEVKIAKDFKKALRTNVVRYSDFGAVGDGKADDFNAIYDAHAFANECGQKVEGDEGAKYYIGENFIQEVIVKTDVNFCGATFIIDDRGSVAFKYRNLGLFLLAYDESAKTYSGTNLTDAIGEGVTISKGDRVFEWITPILEGKSLVRVINSKHKDFIRRGANQNNGNDRNDTYVIEVDGRLEDDIEVEFDFDQITKIEVRKVDNAPITVENGNFETICCRTVIDTGFICIYKGYTRGFKLQRPNSTIKNIKHTMIDEPALNVHSEVDQLGNKKEKTANYGTRDESYPYSGFFAFSNSYNVTARDSILDGHTTYYEDKPETASTGKVPDPVAMGTYDLTISTSSKTYLINIIQQDNENTGIGDQRYWGIMASNFTKNMYFEGCYINRFDAHCGFWNATLIDTTLGHSFNVIGGGKLYCKNVTKVTGNAFISLRADYGANFEGDIELVDCTFVGMKSYYSNRANPGKEDYNNINTSGVVISSGFNTSNSGGIVYETDENGEKILDENGEPIIKQDGRYWYWNFGYTCYMPQNVIIDNFKSGPAACYVFNQLPDEIFGDIPNQYQKCLSVTFRNMKPLDVCAKKEDYAEMNAIPIIIEND